MSLGNQFAQIYNFLCIGIGRSGGDDIRQQVCQLIISCLFGQAEDTLAGLRRRLPFGADGTGLLECNLIISGNSDLHNMNSYLGQAVCDKNMFLYSKNKPVKGSFFPCPAMVC